jgi:hypothetical protein
VQINWPVTAYLSGLVLAAPWLVERCRDLSRWRQAWYGGTCGTVAVLGVAAVVVLFDTEPVRPALVKLAGPPSAENAIPLRSVDPTCRLRGWRHLGQQVDAVREELRARGEEPVVSASRWTMASELAFYCNGHPAVYSVGAALWDRQSQFDLWRPNPVLDADAFRGRTFIFVDVGRLPPQVAESFDHVEPTRKVIYAECGIPVSIWDLTVCRGFRGFSSLPRPHY